MRGDSISQLNYSKAIWDVGCNVNQWGSQVVEASTSKSRSCSSSNGTFAINSGGSHFDRQLPSPAGRLWPAHYRHGATIERLST